MINWYLWIYFCSCICFQKNIIRFVHCHESCHSLEVKDLINNALEMTKTNMEVLNRPIIAFPSRQHTLFFCLMFLLSISLFFLFSLFFHSKTTNCSVQKSLHIQNRHVQYVYCIHIYNIDIFAGRTIAAAAATATAPTTLKTYEKKEIIKKRKTET